MKVLQTLVLIISLATFANAQNVEKMFVLSGTVCDVEKSLIPATEVAVEDKGGRKFQTISDENGFYKLSLPFGEYTITFHKDGFKFNKYTNFINLNFSEKTLDTNLEIRTCYDCEGFNVNDNNEKMSKDSVVSQKQAKNENYLTGKITDQFGAVIPKAQVIVLNEKSELFAAETNEAGIYSLSLPYENFDAKTSLTDFKIFKYQITVDLTNRGFEKFIVKDFKFFPNLSEKMFFDIALDSLNPEPCGYAGADCMSGEPIRITKSETKISDKILQKPLEQTPKEKNKNKRKN